MSTLAFPPINEQEIFKSCRKQCGIIMATDDYQYFSLNCLFCNEKYMYFDAFMGHMQTCHATDMGLEQHQHQQQSDFAGDLYNDHGSASLGGLRDSRGHLNVQNSMSRQSDLINSDDDYDDPEDDDDEFNEADAPLFEPQMVMVKAEVMDEAERSFDPHSSNNSRDSNDMHSSFNANFPVKQELQDHSSMSLDDQPFDFNESFNQFDDYGGTNGGRGGAHNANTDYDNRNNGAGRSTQGLLDDDANYDDLVEESLLSDRGLVMHIKDRKMIQFLIDAYRRNVFLWDHRHPQFRDRTRRSQFLDWMIGEFKRRFNISLARDAVTRKWDNLRTVYKRECNRMSLENTNVSTLWYFKDLSFLNRLYGGNQKVDEAIIKEATYRRRFSALWNDVSTNKLLAMVQQYPCFYDKQHVDYRSKEKRGEALQAMAAELQKMIDVTTIQISKRISQLRFDYSKQKSERLQCELTNKTFVPSYSYYEQMKFMDADVSPFRCEFCPAIVQTSRELDSHMVTHQSGRVPLNCDICRMTFYNNEQLQRHKRSVHSSSSSSSQHNTKQEAVAKYQCDLCTASFRDKNTYDEHVRRHNDELLLPSLMDTPLPSEIGVGGGGYNPEKPYTCDLCSKSFSSASYLATHRALHSSTHHQYNCDYPQCGKIFMSRQSLLEHTKLHYNSEEYFKCEVCGKGFRSPKNLQNHKQIHDAVKRYVCKICGSAFAQAAGLYLHKRRHNRPGSRLDHSY